MKYDYDIIALGGGAAGLGIAGIAANLGAKACMIETEKLGGDCTWHGCVPSKVLLKASKVAYQLRHASRYGLHDTPLTINFENVINHVHHIREEIYQDADAPELFEAMGIDVKSGFGSFLDKHTLQILKSDGTTEIITGKYITICTGSNAKIPPIKGLDTVPFFTNESLFESKRLPEHLAIIGAGPIGIEMAQAFQRLGTQVIVFEQLHRILPKDHEKVASLLQEKLEQEGIQFELGTVINEILQTEKGIEIHYQKKEKALHQVVAAVLVATGRAPNVKQLQLEKAGVIFDKHGIKTNKKCRTNIRNIYACGDVLGDLQFTHRAEQTAKVVIMNALFKLPTFVSNDFFPWVTYTDPEVAHVGASETSLQAKGVSYETYHFPYSKIDRAITDSETTGFIRVYAKKWSGRILGVDMIGAHAGDLISEYTLAMKQGISLRQMADTIHPYPTYGLGNRRAADQWYIKNQSLWQIKLIRKIFGYRGKLPDLSNPNRIV